MVNEILNSHIQSIRTDQELPTQIYRGVNAITWDGQHPGSCSRHMAVFNRSQAIPEYCFNCFKITFKLKNVVDLIKLFRFFDDLKLTKDNTRKCLVECREQITGSYGGLIYCTGIDEAMTVHETVEKLTREAIGDSVEVGIKRGCSEFGVAYSEYAKVEQGKTFMDYDQDWAKHEEAIDKEFVVEARDAVTDSHNESSYTLQDASTILAWMMYAETIGDKSYLMITDGAPVPPFQNIKRPPFRAD